MFTLALPPTPMLPLKEVKADEAGDGDGGRKKSSGIRAPPLLPPQNNSARMFGVPPGFLAEVLFGIKKKKRGPGPTPNRRRPLCVSAAVQTHQPLSDSPTRTLTTLAAVTLAAFKAEPIPVVSIAAQHAPAIASAAGPLFFAALPNTPLAVVAVCLSECLKIYGGVLMVRVLLSWFPNLPWDRQPLSALRDLCDPFLNLFQDIIPDIGNLNMSAVVAFVVLRLLRSILSGGVH